MAEGTIARFLSNRGFGFIKQDDGGDDLFFHISSAKELSEQDLESGTRVYYEIGSGPQGLRAKLVRPLAAQAASRSAQSLSREEIEPRNDFFLNPYNFVRYLDKSRQKRHVLGDCPPPPHDRYLGFNGRITCTVKVVTPLFVSDTHRVKEETVTTRNGMTKSHRTYRFFEYADSPALPASSLRGMIRSVFEAVTNSCFSTFQEDKDNHMEFRLTRDPGLIPARVLQVSSNGEAKLELFDCSTMSPPVKCEDRPATVKSGMISAYTPKVLSRPRGRPEFSFRTRGIVPTTFRDGDRVAALVNTTRQLHRSRRFQWFQVEEIVPVASHTSLRAGSGQRKVFGYLHITGPNIENKHDERLFFRWDDTDTAAQKTYSPKMITVDENAVNEHNRSLRGYWERLGERVNDLEASGWPTNPTTLPFPSTFVRARRKLEAGDLVYYFQDRYGRQHICPVSMPRTEYRFAREELVPKHLHKCGKFEELCPACRVFGWIHSKPEDDQAIAAYAGRVCLSHGKLITDKGTVDQPGEDGIPLAILSSPKPTTTQFYLLDPDGQPSGKVDYNSDGARLRGRKFYRHHGNEPSGHKNGPEYKRLEGERDDQNRSVKGVRKPGNVFRFTLDFENLAEEELGALLYALELEEGMHHRLGFGKPLGLGSVGVEIEALELLNPAQRYTSLESSPLCLQGEQCGDWIDLRVEAFQKGMQSIYGNRPFAELPNVQDLRHVLGDPPMKAVHYPRLEEPPVPDGENFKWFVANKRRRGPLEPLALGLASEDDGLPSQPNPERNR